MEPLLVFLALLNLMPMGARFIAPYRLRRSKSLTWQILPSSFTTYVLTIAYYHLSAQQYCIRYPLNMHTFIGSIIDTLMLCCGTDRQRSFRIKNNQVSITTRGNGSFAGEKSKEFGRHS